MLRMSVEVQCLEVMGFWCLMAEEEVAAAIKCTKIRETDCHTGVVSEMMKSSGGFGTRWMMDMGNNNAK